MLKNKGLSRMSLAVNVTVDAAPGGMVIACANSVLQQGYNPQMQIIAVCTDIDEVAARMCYVQLALLGIPAIVNIGNSLTLDVRQTLYTPMLMLNSFRFKSFLTA